MLVAVTSNSCDPMDSSLPGSSTHGILQARILEWVATSFSKQHVCMCVSCSVVTRQCVCVCESRSVVSDSLWSHGLQSPWNSPGKNTGVGGLSLLQGIFPTQGLNPGLPHCWQILYQLSHKGSPRILEWVAYPFPGGSSQPRNQTCRVSCTAGGFFTNWAIREANSFR